MIYPILKGIIDEAERETGLHFKQASLHAITYFYTDTHPWRRIYVGLQRRTANLLIGIEESTEDNLEHFALAHIFTNEMTVLLANMVGHGIHRIDLAHPNSVQHAINTIKHSISAHPMETPLVVLCETHGTSPFALICEHLLENPNQTWCIVPLRDDDPREVEGDYICQQCEADEIPKDDDKAIAVMQTICLNCVKLIRPPKNEP